jgi:enterochelin esterase family protein
MKALVGIALLLCSMTLQGQQYDSFTKSIHKLYTSTSQDEASRFWSELIASQTIPLTAFDSVAFLYKGDAKSVAWNGDFNGWGYDKKFNNSGKRIKGTDIWILKASFPNDARLDYKIVVDETNWILDPLNTDQQWSGVGGGSPNSELRMPNWQEDPTTVQLIRGASAGRVEKDIILNSVLLGYQVSYSIYLPPDYKGDGVYPVVYVTDGYEYMHERMGNMVMILNNLIHQKKIKPVVAVFIDHRAPADRSNNRRMRELAMNQKFLEFVTDELIPKVEKQYTISTDPSQRAILGTSMGGLTAAYFAFSKPDLFGLCGIQSPAFWFRPDIYTFCDNPEKPPVKTFMSTGTIHDTEEGARKMKDMLNKNTCTYEYREVNQGHSWGNWRDLIDDMLIYFFPAN